MDVGRYLQRISYDGPLEPTEAVLRAVQWAHLENVPFEDLDIHAGLGVRLEERWLFQKIVEQRRGGLCFELNGSFAALLEAMGFEVARLSAQVFMEDGSLTPEFDHLVLLVTLRERWLADVGFGECFRVPLRLDDREVQDDGFGVYRLEPAVGAQDRIIVNQRLPGREWEPRYQLTMTARRLEDFAGMAHFHGTSPESHFAQRRLCTRATPQGRITLKEDVLETTTGYERVEESVRGPTARQKILRKHFDIDLDRGE